jgi:predicted metal-binding protein
MTTTTTVEKRRAATLLLWLPLLVFRYSHALSVIKVCQNKDCCRNFQGKSSLVQVLQDLTDDNSATPTTKKYTIQSTGCLSKCDQGPNVCIDDVITNGIQTPLHAAALIPNASSKLINAVLLLEKAQAGRYCYRSYPVPLFVAGCAASCFHAPFHTAARIRVATQLRTCSCGLVLSVANINRQGNGLVILGSRRFPPGKRPDHDDREVLDPRHSIVSKTTFLTLRDIFICARVVNSS